MRLAIIFRIIQNLFCSFFDSVLLKSIHSIWSQKLMCMSRAHRIQFSHFFRYSVNSWVTVYSFIWIWIYRFFIIICLTWVDIHNNCMRVRWRLKKCASVMTTIEIRFCPSSRKRASTFSLLNSIFFYLINKNITEGADAKWKITYHIYS